jgi:hypothetical protein
VRGETAAALVRSLFCGFRPGQIRMAVFTAFSDESEIAPNPTGDFIVGGYVALESYWPYLAGAWQDRVLDGSPKIPYLHMTDIRNEKWRTKHRISHAESQRRVTEAVKLLSTTGDLNIILSRINRAELAEVIHKRYRRKRDVPENLAKPDYFCFLTFCVDAVAGICGKYENVDKIYFVVSRKEVVTNYIKEAHKDLPQWLGARQPSLVGKMGDIIPASMDSRLPLQAADVLCWHLQRYFAKTSTPMDTRRRKSLAAGRDGYEDVWSREQLEKIADIVMPLPPKLKD